VRRRRGDWDVGAAGHERRCRRHGLPGQAGVRRVSSNLAYVRAAAFRWLLLRSHQPDGAARIREPVDALPGLRAVGAEVTDVSCHLRREVGRGSRGPRLVLRAQWSARPRHSVDGPGGGEARTAGMCAQGRRDPAGAPRRNVARRPAVAGERQRATRAQAAGASGRRGRPVGGVPGRRAADLASMRLGVTRPVGGQGGP